MPNPVKLLLNHFPDLTRLPGSIPELRKLILQRAVRGELTADWRKANPDTEPASVLLEKIQAEKARLVKAGKIKKQKPLPEIWEDEVPFSLPEGWEWSNLATLGIINPRNTVDDEVEVSFVPMASISEKYGESVEHEQRKWGEIKSGYTHFAENDVCIAKITPCFENGKSCIMTGLTNGLGAGTTELHVFRPIVKETDTHFVYLYLRNPDFSEVGKTKMTGTAGQKRLPKEYFAFNPMPLPPLAEQQEIVARVERLLGLCDRLEAAQETEESVRIRTRRASLAALDGDSGFLSAWRAVHTRFDSLIRTPEDVRELRKTILQLAVRGRLTEDWRRANSDVEPASVLLEKIKAEKTRLVKAGKIKKQKPLPEIGEDEVPFALPEGWEWCRLGAVMLTMSTGPFGSMLHKADYVINGVPIINPTNIKCGVIVDNGIKKISLEKAHQLSRYQLFKGDIVLARRGDLTKCAIIKDELSGYYCGTGSFFLRTPTYIFEPFFSLFYSSSTCQGVLESNSVGTTMDNLNQSLLKTLTYPLMSFSEQQEIVTRVERLLGMCDRLEADLADAGETGEQVWRALGAG